MSEIVLAAQGIATVAAALSTVIGYFFGRKSSADPVAPEREVSIRAIEADEDPLRAVVESRLREARQFLQNQNSYAVRNIWAMHSLVFGQYIVGALLASAFLQSFLTPTLVGLLGLLVIVSSSVQQRFRPDIKALGAKGRALRLKALLREMEIQLAAQRAGQASAPSLHQIASTLTEKLGEIEAGEERELDALLKEQTAQLRTKP